MTSRGVARDPVRAPARVRACRIRAFRLQSLGVARRRDGCVGCARRNTLLDNDANAPLLEMSWRAELECWSRMVRAHRCRHGCRCNGRRCRCAAVWCRRAACCAAAAAAARLPRVPAVRSVSQRARDGQCCDRSARALRRIADAGSNAATSCATSSQRRWRRRCHRPWSTRFAQPSGQCVARPDSGPAWPALSLLTASASWRGLHVSRAPIAWASVEQSLASAAALVPVLSQGVVYGRAAAADGRRSCSRDRQTTGAIRCSAWSPASTTPRWRS